MPRNKFFLQTGDPVKAGIVKYSYTGRQLRIGLLTADVADCPEIAEILEKYNEYAASKQFPAANYIIVTIYQNGQDHIDEHSDKTKDFDDNSLLTVVKLGPGERSFVIRDGKGGKELFNEKLSVGSAVLMTVAGNNSTTHEVPIDDSTELSGSIVFRTIKTREPFEKVCKAVQGSDTGITKYVKFFHEGRLLNPLLKPRVAEDESIERTSFKPLLEEGQTDTMDIETEEYKANDVEGIVEPPILKPRVADTMAVVGADLAGLEEGQTNAMAIEVAVKDDYITALTSFNPPLEYDSDTEYSENDSDTEDSENEYFLLNTFDSEWNKVNGTK